jgi:hypothetical protein
MELEKLKAIICERKTENFFGKVAYIELNNSHS